MALTSADLARLGPQAQKQARRATSRERRQAESVRFFVDGRPVPKGRPRVTRHGTYTPKSTREYEAAIRAAWERENVMPFAAGDALELDVMRRISQNTAPPGRKSSGKRRRKMIIWARASSRRGAGRT